MCYGQGQNRTDYFFLIAVRVCCVYCFAQTGLAMACVGELTSAMFNIYGSSCSGILRKQKLRFPLVGAQGYQRFPLFNPGVVCVAYAAMWLWYYTLRICIVFFNLRLFVSILFANINGV